MRSKFMTDGNNQNLPDWLASSLAAVVSSHRDRLGISQEELASRAQLHRTYISDIERGTRNISLKSLSRIAQALDQTASSLLKQSEIRAHALALADAVNDNDREQVFRKLQGELKEFFWVGAPGSGKMFYMSPAFEEMWGLSPQALYDNPRIWLDVVHPDDRDRVLKVVEQEGIAPTSIDIDYRILRPDRSVRHLWVRTHLIYDQDGRAEKTAGIGMDITEYATVLTGLS